jgi:thiamine kinase-like enzyme
MLNKEKNVIQAVTRQIPGAWCMDYARQLSSGSCVYVVREDDSEQFIAVRNDIKNQQLPMLDVPQLGQMYFHPVTQDPAFNKLSSRLQKFSDLRVLRYRPGKRITLQGNHLDYGDVIVKCIVSGVEAPYSRLLALWEVRDELAFEISQPLLLEQSGHLFLQRKLLGNSPVFTDLSVSGLLARNMAKAVASLHHSSLRLEDVFSYPEQEKRSQRYINDIASGFSTCAEQVRELQQALLRLASSCQRQHHSLVPIHGSLHSHQWLVGERNLALVDFDRACMGHVELDIATFLAEWDFEDGSIAESIKEQLLSAYSSSCTKPLDEKLLTYYRAHKHLSKAYKASKSVVIETRQKKIQRALNSAKTLIDNLEINT